MLLQKQSPGDILWKKAFLKIYKIDKKAQVSDSLS